MAGQQRTGLQIGDAAPPFSLKDADRKTVSLQDFAGKTVVLTFFPAAFSGTCTCELGMFRDSCSELAGLNATILGISVDLPWTLHRFRVEENLPFRLLSDFDHTTIEAYGIVDDNFSGYHSGVAQRSVFVVDPAGKIAWSWVSTEQGQLPEIAEVCAAVEQLAPVRP